MGSGPCARRTSGRNRGARTTVLVTSALVAALASGCGGGDEPADPTPSSTTSTTTTATATATPTQTATEDPAVALQDMLSKNLGDTAALLDERSACPTGEDLTCLTEVTTKVADLARTDIPRLEAAIAAGGVPCLQEVARLQVQVLELYVEQDRLFTEGAPDGDPLDEIAAANDAVAPLRTSRTRPSGPADRGAAAARQESSIKTLGVEILDGATYPGPVTGPADEVDRIVAAWRRERPDLDVSPLEVLSRVDRLSPPPRPGPARRLRGARPGVVGVRRAGGAAACRAGPTSSPPASS